MDINNNEAIKDLDEEKKILAKAELSCDEDHDERYNVSKEILDAYNENLKRTSELRNVDIKEESGIKTKKRTDREYNKIWSEFLKNHAASFKKYMGYGVEEINKIGFKKFIDFMDWRIPEDILRYKYDAIKVIPCQDCGNHFTTYQLDWGICDECKKVYDLEKFSKACIASDAKDPGSSGGLIVMFAYYSDFRKIYRKDISFKDRVHMCIREDLLKGLFSQEFVEDIAGDSDKESEFIAIASELPMLQSVANKLITIERIFLDEISKSEKLERLKQIF